MKIHDVMPSSAEYGEVEVMIQAASEENCVVAKLQRFSSFIAPRLVFLVDYYEFADSYDIPAIVGGIIGNSTFKCAEFSYEPKQKYEKLLIFTANPSNYCCQVEFSLNLNEIILLYSVDCVFNEQCNITTNLTQVGKDYDVAIKESEFNYDILSSELEDLNSEAIDAENELFNSYKTALEKLENETEFLTNKIQNERFSFLLQKQRLLLAQEVISRCENTNAMIETSNIGTQLKITELLQQQNEEEDDQLIQLYSKEYDNIKYNIQIDASSFINFNFDLLAQQQYDRTSETQLENDFQLFCQNQIDERRQIADNFQLGNAIRCSGQTLKQNSLLGNEQEECRNASNLIDAMNANKAEVEPQRAEASHYSDSELLPVVQLSKSNAFTIQAQESAAFDDARKAPEDGGIRPESAQHGFVEPGGDEERAEGEYTVHASAAGRSPRKAKTPAPAAQSAGSESEMRPLRPSDLASAVQAPSQQSGIKKQSVQAKAQAIARKFPNFELPSVAGLNYEELNSIKEELVLISYHFAELNNVRRMRNLQYSVAERASTASCLIVLRKEEHFCLIFVCGEQSVVYRQQYFVKCGATRLTENGVLADQFELRNKQFRFRGRGVEAYQQLLYYNIE